MKRQDVESNQLSNVQESLSESPLKSLNMKVYNELYDQTQSEVNVIDMINQQFAQINEMQKRRSLILKDIANYIVK
ncbi:MAG: hypothetical protein ACK41T_05970 [Pseudobdellovibrio sp.]